MANVLRLFHDLSFFVRPTSNFRCTLQYVQPRVRFFERAKEIEHCEPIDKQRNEYRTLMLIDDDNERIIHSIYPREVSLKSEMTINTEA